MKLNPVGVRGARGYKMHVKHHRQKLSICTKTYILIPDVLT